ncbi:MULTISPECIES: CsbD family protein [Alteromonadaceae]|uniref:CsbD family protein n=1 Tax=Alteromonadaceae TaxID=72275 RepID=UPI001C090C33|nr:MULTISPECIES: CsbD family protein [Aliiglaciecola]MBU2876324.1 CsbD family protein [Aliiglaciecola lipolytica]MDO6710540.1 CsbD family protein [Aliiglaciecola sp. 2_MG-2023]MDO6751595.1 CsbD family protein [Aliiglaciecola sp. 1_MG-2023]
MNDDQIKGNWKELKGKVQKNWGKITNDDLDKMEGTRKELVGKVQQSYGKSKEEAEKQVDQFLNS